jgi:hypothetical protein
MIYRVFSRNMLKKTTSISYTYACLSPTEEQVILVMSLLLEGLKGGGGKKIAA